MKTTLLALLGAALSLAAGLRPSAEDPLKVVTTIPDLADFVRQIGGERVDVRSLARGRENIHAVRILPSHLAATSRADLFVQMGLSMEHAWVPALFRTAKNKDIAIGTPGFVSVSEGWEAIQIPEQVDRKYGVDIHPRGNPHFNLHPKGGLHIAARVHAALCAKDPGSKEHYDRRYAALVERLEAAEERWAKLREKLAGHVVVEFHRDFDYFARSCGVEVAETLEPWPGVPPSPGHLAEVIERMKRREIGVILTTAYTNNKSVRSVAKKTDAAVLELPNMVEGAAGCDTWIDMMDHLHRELARALGVETS